MLFFKGIQGPTNRFVADWDPDNEVRTHAYYTFAMVLSISICKFDAENTPDAFEHVPDLF